MFNFIKIGYTSYFLVTLTIAISLIAWKYPKLTNKLISNGPDIFGKHQWYRSLTSAFLHLDFAHLFLNMFALYSLGPILEDRFSIYFGGYFWAFFILFYIFAAIVSDLLSVLPHRNNSEYSTLGASGAVVGVIALASIIDFKLDLIVYGVTMPGWAYLIAYIAISTVLNHRSRGNVNHLAHISGAMLGVILGLLIAHAGIITSATPTYDELDMGSKRAEVLLDKLNTGTNLKWKDVSGEYWTRHNLAYLDAKGPLCSVILFRSEGEILKDSSAFSSDSYLSYGESDLAPGVWIAVNSDSKDSECHKVVKSVLNWE